MATVRASADAMMGLIRRVAQKFPDKVAVALYQEAQIEMTESKRRCPVDTTPHAPHPGQLRASGKVHPPERRGKNITVTMSYDTYYAVYVHEILDNFHPVGQAKYLESVLNESAPYMSARIARRINLNEEK